MFQYRCEIVSVVDGDTVHALVDLGCDVKIALTLRLAGLNAPEMSTPEGPAAKAELTRLLDPGSVVLTTIKDHREKYGRYLAFLTAGGVAVNDALLEGGFAVPYPIT